jgi:hypothetical protein
MLGSTAAELLPTGDTGTSGPAAHAPGAPPPDAARREPTALPPLLRSHGGALVVADRESAWPDVEEPTELDGPVEAPIDVATVVAQLAPIRSHEALASSYSREANPDDFVVRAAYARVWEDLALVIARGTTRRARIRSMTAPLRRRR